MSAPSWVWLALVDERPADADAAARARDLDGAPAGHLACWTCAAMPCPGALRASREIIDRQGAGALVSLVRAPPGVRIAFDDLSVQQARRAVLAGRPAEAVSTLLSDDSHFEGSITAWRGVSPASARADPFARVFPGRLLRVDAGLIGRCPPPCGPTIERYGSAAPWPWDRFAAQPARG